MPDDRWLSGGAYERFMGRWSRRIAVGFLEWLAQAPHQVWLDVGCGTGALTTTILATSEPAAVTGLDLSEPFIAAAAAAVGDRRVSFRVGDVQRLPFEDQSFDTVVAGLSLNFMPEPHRAVAEMTRVARAGGAVGAYVWDYSRGMQMLRTFWDAARKIDPSLAVDEAQRNPLCAPEPLERLFAGARLANVEVESIEIETRFADFDDYWAPFEGGTGPAPAYLRALDPDARAALAGELRRSLKADSAGSIVLRAGAWAVKGSRHHDGPR